MCQIVAMCQTEERYILLRICYENEKMCFAKRHNSKVLKILIKCTVYIAAISELQRIVYSNKSYLRHVASMMHITFLPKNIMILTFIIINWIFLNYHSTSTSLVYLNVTDDQINVNNMPRSFSFNTANNLYNYYIRIHCILKGGWL